MEDGASLVCVIRICLLMLSDSLLGYFVLENSSGGDVPVQTGRVCVILCRFGCLCCFIWLFVACVCVFRMGVLVASQLLSQLLMVLL